MAGTQSRLDRKFLGDSAWNYAAFALMAATGVVLNFFIAAYFGIETLGVFNQIYAVYVVTAQLAVFGIHDSAQKYIAEYVEQADQRRSIALSAILIALAFGASAAVIIYLSSSGIGTIASSESVGAGVALAAPGLLFFALNKVLLGILNGERRMRAFAIAQGGRVLSILTFTGLVALMNWPGYVLGAGFSIAEMIIIGPVIWAVKPWTGVSDSNLRHWLNKHINFGYRAIANGFLAESYIRVDVIMLGVFVSDHDVGIYSFAALFIEGLYQVPVVVRTVVNPMLVRLIGDDAPGELRTFARKVMAMSFVIFAITAIAVVLIFPYLAPYFPDGLVDGSYPVLLTVVIGLGIYAAFIPVDFVLLQAGMPGRQSLLMTANISINIALNAVLIPLMGIEGAALATAIAFTCSALTLNVAVHRWLGLRGGFVGVG